MNNHTDLLISKTVRYVVNLLVDRKYKELEMLTKGVRLNAMYIEAGVVDYGRKLIAPPEFTYDNIDVIPIKETTPNKYSVRFDLYTEEGLSDLSIEMTLIDDLVDSDLMMVEIDNIHVL